jgi:lysophospholipase L1-like esterase
MASAQTTQPAAPARGARGGRGPGALNPANPNLRTIWIASDSTAAMGTRGWGSHMADYFDTGKINIVNGAVSGQSSRTFQSAGSWNRIISKAKKDDIILIQFGHNDITDIDIRDRAGAPDPARQRGDIQTLGEETVQSPLGETVHTYGWYMRKMIHETQEKGAIPIIVSMTVRNIWTGGKVERGANEMARMAIQLAKDQKIQYVDLNNTVADLYETMGPEKVQPLYQPDKTHSTVEGADLNAHYITAGLKALKEHPFDQYLTEKGKEVEPATKYAPKE